MIELPHGEKKCDDMFIRFDVIHERDRRTDRQTDRQTNKHTNIQTPHDTIDRACIASGGKNEMKLSSENRKHLQ